MRALTAKQTNTQTKSKQTNKQIQQTNKNKNNTSTNHPHPHLHAPHRTVPHRAAPLWPHGTARLGDIVKMLINIVYYFICCIVLMIVFEYNVSSMLLTFTTLAVSVSFAIGPEIQRTFGVLRFLLLQRPFYVGACVRAGASSWHCCAVMALLCVARRLRGAD